jgi:hypothetical protein
MAAYSCDRRINTIRRSETRLINIILKVVTIRGGGRTLGFVDGSGVAARATTPRSMPGFMTERGD